MFAVDTFIDSVQYIKKSFVNTYITDKNVRDSLNAFVDTQTSFTKQIFRTAETVSKEFVTQTEKTFESFSKVVK